MISYEDFKKLDIRIGTIEHAEPVPGTDKLLKLTVNLGEESTRTIVSGIKEFFPDIADLEGRQVAFVVNMEPREICGVLSEGMILAVRDDEAGLALLSPHKRVAEGGTVS